MPNPKTFSPARLLSDSVLSLTYAQLSPSAKAVWTIHCGIADRATASHRYGVAKLAVLSGLSEGVVKAANRELAKAGFISREWSGDFTKSATTILCQVKRPWVRIDDKSGGGGSTASDTTPSAADSTTLVSPATLGVVSHSVGGVVLPAAPNPRRVIQDNRVQELSPSKNGESSTLHRFVVARFCDAWAKVHGAKYHFAGGKDGAIASKLAKALKDEAEAEAVIAAYFATRDRFIIEKAHPFSLLLSNVNQFRVKSSTTAPSSGAAAMPHQRNSFPTREVQVQTEVFTDA